MRYTDKLIFVKLGASDHYDPVKGEYVSAEPTEFEQLGKITRPTKERKDILFGDQKINQIIVHMKQPMTDSYDYMLFEGKKYFFVSQSTVSSRQIVYMRGDDNGLQSGNEL